MSKKNRGSSSSSDESTDSETYIDFTGLVPNNNYLLIKKIGSGAFSSVWLAYNIQKKGFNAIKIQFTEDYEDAKYEVKLMRKMKKYDCRYLNVLVESFKYESEYGKHMCMVFELYAGSLFDLIKSGKYMNGLPINVVKSITKQILLGMKTLHNDLKIIHTDLKPENILFVGINNKLKDLLVKFNEMDFDSILEKNIEQYKKEHGHNNYNFLKKKDKKKMLIKKTGATIIKNLDLDLYAYSSSESDYSSSESEYERLQSEEDITDEDDEEVDIEIEEDGEEESESEEEEEDFCIVDDVYVENCEIRISDFGNYCTIDDTTEDEIQTRYYRAPEVILNCPYNEKCDMWSIACIVFELLTGDLLFDPPKSEEMNRDKHHLYWIQQLLGDIPKDIIDKSKRKKYFFDKKYKIKGLKGKVERWSLQDVFMEEYSMDKKNAEEISEFLMYLLKYRTDDRFSSDQCIVHSWLK